MKKDCTIIILSYNVKSITDTCIQKAKVAVRYCEEKMNNNVNIIVVDNASSDGTGLMIKKKHPEVMLVALKKNMGPAYGYNAGMKKTKTPYMILINSDAFLYKTTVYDALKYLDSHKGYDVLTGQINSPDYKFAGVGGHLPTPMRTIRWLLGLDNIPYFRKFMKRIYRTNKEDFGEDKKLEWIPTCFFILRREVFDKTKGCDEHFFFYGEDIEWCKRINDLGMSIYYTPKLKVMHLGGASTTKKSKDSQLFWMQTQVDGIRYYFKKHYPDSTKTVDLFLWFGFRLRGMLYEIINNKTKAYLYKRVVI